MKIFRASDSPFRAADASSFAGPAQTKLLASSEEASSEEASSEEVAQVHLYHVRFEPGARTNWHTHSGPQWLFVTEGRIRVQRWGERAHDIGEGDAVVFSPGEKHWHGASAGARGVHLAVNVNVKTEWLEPVTDEDYFAPAVD